MLSIIFTLLALVNVAIAPESVSMKQAQDKAIANHTATYCIGNVCKVI